MTSAAEHPARRAFGELRYHGLTLHVPAGWPVIRTGRSSRVCVRFNRHAIYLGRPGAIQSCPADAVGRTEAILASPSGRRARDRPRAPRLTVLPTVGAPGAGGGSAELFDPAAGVTVTATWRAHPGVVARALGLRSPRLLLRAAGMHRRSAPPSPQPPRRQPPRVRALAVSAATPAIPGAPYDGLGFDTCSAPSLAAMAAWGAASPYGAAAIYIGGADEGCPVQPNLTANWVAAESAAGWHLVPLYVGLQAPTNQCPVASGQTGPGCAPIPPAQAVADGTAAAEDAVARAQALGIGTGNPIYFDMEGYARTASASATVLAFLQAWTQQLHASGYLSGVYSSAASGIVDLASRVGTGYVEPDDIWIADWTGTAQSALADVQSRYGIPATDWPGAQRLYQYQGANDETYGQVEINVDNDYLDGATAAAGSAAPGPAPAAPAPAPVTPAPAPIPSLRLAASGNGSLAVRASWANEPGLSSFELLAGPAPGSLAPIETVPAAQAMPIVLHTIHAYFAVAGLAASGQVLGTSAPLRAPARVAVFADAAFVSPRGHLSVPVACMNATPCRVSGAVYRGRLPLTETAPEHVSRYGGLLHLALGPREVKTLLRAHGRRLPARLSVTNGAGLKTKVDVTLVPYAVAGAGPQVRAGASASVRILDTTALVSNGWVGEIPVACAAQTECRVSLRVATRSGAAIATGRTPTLGAGEIAPLHFQMTRRGHALLARTKGNQLPARITVDDVPVAATGAAPLAHDPSATALVSLVSYR